MGELDFNVSDITGSSVHARGKASVIVEESGRPIPRPEYVKPKIPSGVSDITGDGQLFVKNKPKEKKIESEIDLEKIVDEEGVPLFTKDLDEAGATPVYEDITGG